MQEKVEIITNHIVQFWTILDKNTQKRILCRAGIEKYFRSFFGRFLVQMKTSKFAFEIN